MAAIDVRINKGSVVAHGLSMGSALAMIMSWGQNRSILYAVGHGFCSWFYVVYYWAKHS